MLNMVARWACRINPTNVFCLTCAQCKTKQNKFKSKSDEWDFWLWQNTCKIYLRNTIGGWAGREPSLVVQWGKENIVKETVAQLGSMVVYWGDSSTDTRERGSWNPQDQMHKYTNIYRLGRLRWKLYIQVFWDCNYI